MSDFDTVAGLAAAYGARKIAGEAYLERVLAATGTRIFHPEAVSVAEQIAAYRMAGHLVFSEGSALHALQLVGSLHAKVTVITRRAGSRLAGAALRPRVRSLRYVDAVSAVVMGANRAGRSQPSAVFWQRPHTDSGSARALRLTLGQQERAPARPKA